MEDFTLEVHRRSVTGSSANRRYRNSGLIPAVIYHRGEESVPVILSETIFSHKAQAALPSQIFRLKSEDSTLDGRPVIVREIQRDYSAARGAILHVDFQALKEDEEIRLTVGLKMEGEAPGVKTEGGILSIVTHEVSIFCFPRDIPRFLQVDISSLHLNQSIHAKDLPLTSGVRLADDPDETIVTVVVPRAAKEDETQAAVAEGAAAVPGTPAPGIATGQPTKAGSAAKGGK